MIRARTRARKRALDILFESEARGDDPDPFDVLLDIVVADELCTGLRPSGLKDSERDWQLRAEVWRDPRAVIGGSDAGAHLDMMCGAIYSTALLSHGVVIIEALNLAEVEPGMYEMYCLPLRVVGGDGAPARVILKR